MSACVCVCVRAAVTVCVCDWVLACIPVSTYECVFEGGGGEQGGVLKL